MDNQTETNEKELLELSNFGRLNFKPVASEKLKSFIEVYGTQKESINKENWCLLFGAFCLGWDGNSQIAEFETEIARLNGLINTPHTADFLEAVPLEAAHQIERWGTSHDEGKTPLDWFWLIGFLSQKVVVSLDKNDLEKAKHHTISTAAVMLNWYRSISNEEKSFQPGITSPEIKAESENAEN